jgi:hypothetical protein
MLSTSADYELQYMRKIFKKILSVRAVEKQLILTRFRTIDVLDVQKSINYNNYGAICFAACASKLNSSCSKYFYLLYKLLFYTGKKSFTRFLGRKNLKILSILRNHGLFSRFPILLSVCLT